jgi:L-asparaginase II
MLEVLIYRGEKIESIHKVHLIVFNNESGIEEAFGNTQELIFPRSAIKPIQALPLVISGAYEHYGLSYKELALASASHSGETIHTKSVSAWLSKVGLSERDLECGIHAPLNIETTFELVRARAKFTQIHNNCSGKHTGMLSVARYLNLPIQSYVKPEHQVQKLIKNIIEELCDLKIDQNSYGIDGCSVPSWVMPLENFARGLARFSGTQFGSKKLKKACTMIFEASQQYPEYIAGTDRFCTNIIKQSNGNVLVKTGAEGVMAAIVKGKLSLGIAVKCVDGTTRAVEAAMASILNKYNLIEPNSNYLHRKIINWKGITTGKIEVMI